MRRMFLVLLALCLLPVPVLAARAKAVAKLSAQAAAKAGPELVCPDSTGLGEPFLVRLRASRPLTGLTVTWLERTLRLSGRPVAAGAAGPGGWEAVVLLGTDVGNTATGRHELVLNIDSKSGGKSGGKPSRVLRQGIVVQPVKRPVESLTLDPDMVTPPADALPRIQAERVMMQKLLSGVLSRAAAERSWSLPLARPVPGEVSSIYGIGRILNGQPHAPHRGLDLEAATGQGVLAAADGVVLFSGELYYAGNAVYLDHGQGLVSSYFHLSERQAVAGQKVARGQQIGLAGATGRSTRSHLHFGLWALGRNVDPEPLFLYGPLP